MTSNGRLIVIEGVDEVGKTTLVRRLADRLSEEDVKVRPLAFPGSETGTLGAHVHALHHQPESFSVNVAPTSLSLQILHIAAHFDAIERVILPALAAGETVILDRFWWSTWVYGLVSGADTTILEGMLEVERRFWNHAVPETIFLICRPEPLSPVPDIQTWKRLAREYQALAEAERAAQRVVIVEATGTVDESLDVILRALEKRSNLINNARQPARRTTNILREKRSKNARAANKSTEPTLFDQYPTSSALPVEQHFQIPTIDVHGALAPTIPTQVYDTYWRFAVKRQEIFFRKLNMAHPPWTNDAILLVHKFTNAYRASDRVSQYLIRHVIYQGDPSPTETFFRIILFKTFNRIETWELLIEEFGEIRWSNYAFIQYDRVLSRALSAGRSIYNGAYIMSSGRSAYGSAKKHRNHLQMIEAMMRTNAPDRIVNAQSMQKVFELLMSFPSIGSFLAYQYTIDINYSTLTSFSEMEFVVPGPGAKDGIRKCFQDYGGLNETDLIRRVADLQEQEFERLELKFPYLWGRRLQLIDCQNLFCEVDKYARVAHPHVVGVSGRTRIKQKYRPTKPPIDYWYPPKWGLNGNMRKGADNVPNI